MARRAARRDGPATGATAGATAFPVQTEEELAAERAHIEDLTRRGVLLPPKRPKGPLPEPMEGVWAGLSELVIAERDGRD